MQERRHGFAVPCILVIEDEGLIGSVTAETVADEGYEVLAVAVGCGALQPVLDWRPCLILVDILMLVMDRTRLPAEAVAAGQTRADTVVLVSGAGGRCSAR